MCGELRGPEVAVGLVGVAVAFGGEVAVEDGDVLDADADGVAAAVAGQRFLELRQPLLAPGQVIAPERILLGDVQDCVSPCTSTLANGAESP